MVEGSLITEELRKAVGVESTPYFTEIDKGAIRKFAEAIEDPNPLYCNEAYARKTRYGGIIAPPTFFRSVISPREATPVESPFSRRLDAGSDWEYFQPVRAGDVITTTVKLADLYEREGRLGKMLFMVNEATYKNQFGELVAKQRSTLITY